MARSTQQFRAPQGVQMKQPEPETQPGAGLFDGEIAAATETGSWLDLPKAPAASEAPGSGPYRGACVMLRGAYNEDGEYAAAEGVWRRTRALIGTSWQPAAYWAKRNAGGQKLGFEPVAYREIVE